MKNVEIISIDSKLVLKLQPSADSWFFTNASINPYRGCSFDCSYCDGKALYYNIPNFGKRIQSKNNFALLLQKQLLKLGYQSNSGKKQKSLLSYVDYENNKSSSELPKKFILSVGGGVTDCYQPVEKDTKVMREIIKVLIDFEIPSFFLTKSTLIERDIDLIGELHDRCNAVVNFSIAFMSESDKKIHEPFSPSINRRFETLERFSSEGIDCGVLAMPILPFISDTEETIEYLVRRAKECKAKHILTSGLTLKPGNRESFLSTLEKNYPMDLIGKYKQIFPEQNTFGHPKITTDLKNPTMIGHILCKKYDVFPRVQRFIPEGCIEENFRLSEHFWYIYYLRKWVLLDCPYSLEQEIKKLTFLLETISYSIYNSNPDFILGFSSYLQEIYKDFLITRDSKERKRLDDLLNVFKIT